MFQKIIKSIKRIAQNLDTDEKMMLGSSIGLVFLGFLIYVMWQSRFEDPEPEPEEEVVEQIEDEDNDDDDLVVDNDYENELHGYEIIDIGNEIEELDQARIFGLREPSDFIVKYQGITHAVFENEEDLPIDKWVENKIDEKGPRGESLEDQKSFLDIFLKRETSTPLGEGIEVVRMNGFQAGELFIPWNDYVMSFHYEVDSAREVSRMESRRDKFIESIN